ncbi:LOW QUALITY PROTEIN: ornithine decarboxylase antizyme 2 [Epargyreus clarus]|uniref:LOW QUALITY PROTEIN: ornithine decarboxylase antizyme 2 n=1 Tax=Epargyreus clarus TaxID=520877 RepID=UPI003C2C7063
MTKLIQQLNFSSSNYYDVAGIEPPSSKPKNFIDEGASLNACGGSKRSALSASDAECFSLCLGAGPLWWSDVPVHSSAPPGGVNGGAASPATPSTPTHDDNHRDLLSALLWSSASSLSSADGSPVDHAHPTQDLARREAIIEKILARKDRDPTKINFKVYLTEQNYTRWECVLKGDIMYLRLPDSLAAGSKEAFMFLLDFAEERLRCTHWIVCVNKSREDRVTVLRTFMFLGFQILAPHSPLAAEIDNPDYILMHYNYN